MSVDKTKSAKTLVRWPRINPDSPAGLHEPKLEGDVGWDLEAIQNTIVLPGVALDIPTNVKLHLPPNVWAEIRARSSIARKGLQVDAGTIDTGYRGPLFAMVRNMRTLQPNELFAYANVPGQISKSVKPKDFRWYMDWAEEHAVTIQKGERIAQVVFHRVCSMWAQEVEEIDATSSERGANGFGSTGT